MKHIIKAYVMLNHLHLYHNTPVPHLLQAPNAMEGGHFFYLPQGNSSKSPHLSKLILLMYLPLLVAKGPIHIV